MARKNAAKERQKIFLAIETIVSTKEARKRGWGAPMKEIRLMLPNIPRVAIDAGLKWCADKGLIICRQRMWYLKEELPKEFCWEHGYTTTLAGCCIKCIAQGKKGETYE